MDLDPPLSGIANPGGVPPQAHGPAAKQCHLPADLEAVKQHGHVRLVARSAGVGGRRRHAVHPPKPNSAPSHPPTHSWPADQLPLDKGRVMGVTEATPSTETGCCGSQPGQADQNLRLREKALTLCERCSAITKTSLRYQHRFQHESKP